MPLAKLLADRAFELDTTDLLTNAFQESWEIVKLGGSRLVEGDAAATVREVLARRIFGMALQGERDLERLVDGALDEISGLTPRDFKPTAFSTADID